MMKATLLSLLALSAVGQVAGAPQAVKRDDGGKFEEGQPISGDGKGAPIFGEYIPYLHCHDYMCI
jgi:hypothetical protein